MLPDSAPVDHSSPCRTAKPPGSHRAASQRYAWQDSNLRPLGPQPNALSPELQARSDHFTPRGLRPAVADRLGREGRDSNPRSAFSALNRLAGGPIRPLWHLPRWLCPRWPAASRAQETRPKSLPRGRLQTAIQPPITAEQDPTTRSVQLGAARRALARISPPHRPVSAAPAVATPAHRHRQCRSGRRHCAAAR